MSDSLTLSATTFDADAQATEPPAMKIGSRVYVGRILSITEWFAFKDRLTAQAKAEKAEGEEKKPETLEAARQLMLAFLRAVFPPIVERRWLVFHRTVDPIRIFESRGLRDVQTSFVRFFIHQRHAMGFLAPLETRPEPSPSPEAGSTSSGRTTPGLGDATPPSVSAPAS